jgi:tetratricopeptide (TPR) repeat protein
MSRRRAVIFALLIGTAFAPYLAETTPAFAQAAPAPAPQPAAPAKPPAAKPVEADAGKLVIAGDLEGYIAEARRTQSTPPGISSALLIAIDDLTKGDTTAANAEIASLSRRNRQGVDDLLEMWSLQIQGDKKGAQARAVEAQSRLAPGLGGLAPAMVAEAGGDLQAAADSYAKYISARDTGPLPDQPSDPASLSRLLEAPRLAQAIYRAALVNHRLGRKDEALKYYLLTDQFSAGAPDVAENIARLQRGAQPLEPALTPRSGLGRWLMFLGMEYQLARLRSGADASAADGPLGVNASFERYSGVIFAGLGLRLEPAADDWRVGAADNLIGLGSAPAAEKLLAGLRPGSPFAAEAKISLARAALLRKGNDAQAAALAREALALGKGRWSIELEAGRTLIVAGHDEEAVKALNNAIAGAPDDADRAEALLVRAGANFQAGRLAEASADAREAVKANDVMSVRMSAVGYLSTTPEGWYEAIRLGRDVLFAQPRSVDAMNTLGYALIQREQGLDEGFKLLARGAAQEPDYYPIVDSLGWAYYQYGDFEQAQKLVVQANDATKDEPNSEILDHLGDIHWRLKRPAEARKVWIQALAAKPDGARKAELEKKLKTGLTSAAPAKRDPPRVDYRPDMGGGGGNAPI